MARTLEDRLSAREIREWAAGNGHQVSERGRIPRHVTDMYVAAHGGPPIPDDEEPRWSDSTESDPDGGTDPLARLEGQLANEETAAAAAAAQPPAGSPPDTLPPPASLDEARERYAQRDKPPRPPWADRQPPAGKRPPRPRHGPAKPVPQAVRDDMTGKVALLLSVPAMTWQAGDPYCGGAFAENVDNITQKLVPLLCLSPDIVRFFQKTSTFMLLLEFAIACQPVGIAVVKHHVTRTVGIDEKTGRPVQLHYRGPGPPADAYPADPAMYTTEVSGHVPQPRPAGN